MSSVAANNSLTLIAAIPIQGTSSGEDSAAVPKFAIRIIMVCYEENE